MDQMPVIDTHQHLWDLDLFQLPWLDSPGVGPLRRSFVMSDYLAATQNCQVEQTIYMEVNVHPDLQQQEARYVLELCGRVDNPMSGAVIGGMPGEAGFGRYLEEFAGNPFVKGVRTVLHDPDRPRGMCLQPQFKENMKLLGELGLSFDLCMRPGEIQDAVELVDACPQTRFIIDHCGNLSVQPDQQSDRAAWENRHATDGRTRAGDVQDFRHHRHGNERKLAARRSEAEHRFLSGYVRGGPRFLRRRLARLHLNVLV